MPELIRDSEESHVVAMVAKLEEVRGIIKSGSLKEILEVKSQAEAMQAYAKRHAKYLDASIAMSEISTLASVRVGELLSQMEKAKGSRGSGSNQHEVRSHDETTPTLESLGISKSQSSRWQKLASIPEQSRISYFARMKERREPVTLKGLAKLIPRPNGTPKESKEPVEHESNVVTDLSELSGQKFKQILADPPWAYGNQATRAATDNHYVTMPLADICAMPVAELADENAQLHLWTTNGFLRDAFDVIDAWGFEYRSCFVWCKPSFGIGNYWRVSHEFLLLGIRGSATFKSKSLKSWAEIPKGKHSAKPESVRAMIEDAFDGPRLELFGRQAVNGWTVFGNEVERSLFT